MKKGSYTVEAALLMGILLPLLVTVIYTGFFLKARAEVKGEALEKGLSAALLGESVEEDGVEVGKTEIHVSTERAILAMPFGSRFFSLPERVTASCTLENRNPAQTVFRLHSLKKVIRQVTN